MFVDRTKNRSRRWCSMATMRSQRREPPLLHQPHLVGTAEEAAMYRKVALLALMMGLIGLWGALPADAVQGRQNGQITFGTFDSILGDFSIWAANPDGTAQRRLTTVPSFFSDWSPDGRWISFNIAPESAATPNAGSVLVVRLHDNRVRVLRSATARLQFFKPVWSPNGRKLLVGCFDTQAKINQICVIRATGRRITVIIAGAPEDVNFPAWGSLRP
jgi:hypothetical protein